MSMAENNLASKKIHSGMVKSRKTRVGDIMIAVVCFVLMLMCLLPMVHVLACSLSSADALVKIMIFSYIRII